MLRLLLWIRVLVEELSLELFEELLLQLLLCFLGNLVGSILRYARLRQVLDKGTALW